MPEGALPRRGVLLGGAALALPFGLGDLTYSAQAAGLPLAPASQPIVGSFVGWATVDSDRVTLRLAEIVGATVIARDMDALSWPYDPARASLHGICGRARDLMVEAAARSWGVPPGECVSTSGRIEHAGQGRSVNYTVWADLV